MPGAAGSRLTSVLSTRRIASSASETNPSVIVIGTISRSTAVSGQSVRTVCAMHNADANSTMRVRSRSTISGLRYWRFLNHRQRA